MTEQDLHEYNKWLMEVWNPNQLYIPFGIDAPQAYLKYRKEQLTLTDVSQQRELLKDFLQYVNCSDTDSSVSFELLDEYLNSL